jgi:hypothetical protein
MDLYARRPNDRVQEEIFSQEIAQKSGCVLLTPSLSFQKSIKLATMGKGRAWIGISDLEQEGTWKWVNDSDLPFR